MSFELLFGSTHQVIDGENQFLLRRRGAEAPHRLKPIPQRHETARSKNQWRLFDLGMTAKTRPVLVVSVAYGDSDRAVVTVVPHTTEVCKSPFEVFLNVPFLRPGAFLVQGVSTYPKAWAVRKLGAIKPDQMEAVANV